MTLSKTLAARRDAKAARKQEAEAAWQWLESIPGLHLSYCFGRLSANVAVGSSGTVYASVAHRTLLEAMSNRPRMIRIGVSTYAWKKTLSSHVAAGLGSGSSPGTVRDNSTDAVLLTSRGTHFDCKANTVLEVGGRTISLPVQGRERRTAVMVARDTDRDLAYFRLGRDCAGRTTPRVVDVAIPVIDDMTTSLVLVVVAAPLLGEYFKVPE